MLDFYKGKRVLVTGHTGFKGSWLSLWLNSLGAEVFGCALEPQGETALFNLLNLDAKIQGSICDIRDSAALDKLFDECKPEMVFHLAAQPLVRFSYEEPVLTYETNVLGTLNVLEAARKCASVKSFVNVTTDKCYENREEQRGYKEDDPMGGFDMYSSSKGCVEIMSASYRRCFLTREKIGYYSMATARAGNVIGGGDWACDRLVPDCARFINADKTIEIRNPNSVRPWQHVLEPLWGYLLLAERLYNQKDKYAQGYNFGPDASSALTVEQIVQKFIAYWGKGRVKVQKTDDLHEAGLLMLNIDKVKKELGWTPIYDADKAVKLSVDWYKAYYSGEDVCALTLAQIKEYEGAIYGKTASQPC